MAGGDNFTWGASSATVNIGETIAVAATYGTAPTASGVTGAFNGLATAVLSSSGVEITGVAAGTVTVPVGTNVGNFVTTTNAFTLTVTAPVEDESYLNKRGLTHFWDNIDDLKQDKLTAGTNITISANNTISASQPTVGNATLTIQKNGTNVQTFTANATSNKTANITVPTNTDILNLIYPVGSIYMSATLATAAAVGSAIGGTWVAWGAGRVPVGVDTSDTDFDAAEETGGEKTHTLTVDEMPNHQHEVYGRTGSTAAGSNCFQGRNWNGTAVITNTGSTGGGDPHNNLQPYITCYMYKRTA